MWPFRRSRSLVTPTCLPVTLHPQFIHISPVHPETLAIYDAAFVLSASVLMPIGPAPAACGPRGSHADHAAQFPQAGAEATA